MTYYASYPKCDENKSSDCFYAVLLKRPHQQLSTRCTNIHKDKDGPCPGHLSRKARGLRPAGIVFNGSIQTIQESKDD